jgi:rod shape-determining protein MreC
MKPNRRRGRRPGVVLALLVLVSLTLMSLDAELSTMRSATASVLGELQALGTSMSRPDTETDRLRTENRKLRWENSRLRAGLEVGRTRTARVIGYGPAQAYAHTIALDAGSRDGVERDATVLSPDGLVGRVVAAGARTSTVLLICDAESTVGARIEGSRELGLLTGNGNSSSKGRLTFRLLDTTASVRTGDRLVSWGSPNARPYLPDVPIGVVTAVHTAADGLTPVAEVKPVVDFTALDELDVAR